MRRRGEREHARLADPAARQIQLPAPADGRHRRDLDGARVADARAGEVDLGDRRLEERDRRARRVRSARHVHAPERQRGEHARHVRADVLAADPQLAQRGGHPPGELLRHGPEAAVLEAEHAHAVERRLVDEPAERRRAAHGRVVDREIEDGAAAPQLVRAIAIRGRVEPGGRDRPAPEEVAPGREPDEELRPDGVHELALADRQILVRRLARGGELHADELALRIAGLEERVGEHLARCVIVGIRDDRRAQLREVRHDRRRMCTHASHGGSSATRQPNVRRSRR
jgi:hypothetical protein